MTRLADRWGSRRGAGIAFLVGILLFCGGWGTSWGRADGIPFPGRHNLRDFVRRALVEKAEGADLQVRLYREGAYTPEESRKVSVRVSLKGDQIRIPYPDAKEGDFRHLVVIGSEQTCEELRQLMGPVVLIGTLPSVSSSPARQEVIRDVVRLGMESDDRSFRFPTDLLFNSPTDSKLGNRTLESVRDATGQPIPDVSYLVEAKVGTDTLLIGPLSFQAPFRSMQPVVLCNGPVQYDTLFQHPDYGIGEGGFSPMGDASPDMELRIALVRKGSPACEHAVRGTLRDPSGKPVPYVRLREEMSGVMTPIRMMDNSIAPGATVWTDAQGHFTYYPPRNGDPRQGIAEFLPASIPFIFWLENPRGADWFPILTTDNTAEKDLAIAAAPPRTIRILGPEGKPWSADLTVRLLTEDGKTFQIESEYLNKDKPLALKGKCVTCNFNTSPMRYEVSPAQIDLDPGNAQELVFRVKPVTQPAPTPTPAPPNPPQPPQAPVPGASQPVPVGVPTPAPQEMADLSFQVLNYLTDEPVSNSLVVFCEMSGDSSRYGAFWKDVKSRWLEYGAPIRNKLADAVMRKVINYRREKQFEVIRPDEQGNFHLKTVVPRQRGISRNTCLAVFHRNFLQAVFSAEIFFPAPGEEPQLKKLYLIREATGRFTIEGTDPRLTQLVGTLNVGPIPIRLPSDPSRPTLLPLNAAGQPAFVPGKMDTLRDGLKNAGLFSLSFQVTTSGTQEFRFPFPAGAFGNLRLSLKDPKSYLGQEVGKLEGTPVPPGGLCDFGTCQITLRVVQSVYIQVQGPSGKPIPNIALRIDRGMGNNSRPLATAHQEVFTDASGVAVFEVLTPDAFQMRGIVYRPLPQRWGGEPVIQEFAFDWNPELSEKKEPHVLRLTEAELQKLSGLISIEQYR